MSRRVSSRTRRPAASEATAKAALKKTARARVTGGRSRRGPCEVRAEEEDREAHLPEGLKAPHPLHQPAVFGLEIHALQVRGADREHVPRLDLASHPGRPRGHGARE